MRYINNKDQTGYIDISSVSIASELGGVVSLFSGSGGLDLGLEQAGYRTSVCVENDVHCRETLKYNRPNWKVFDSPYGWKNGIQEAREPGDIRKIEVEELLDFAELKKGEASLVVGGAPCQPFSNIGKRQGQHDKKNGDLFLEFVRMVKGVGPKAFIFENVTGIAQSKHSVVIEYMKRKFQEIGYGVSHSILNAADYGVPQRRKRFFMIGIKGVEAPCFPLPTHAKDAESWQSFAQNLDMQPKVKIHPWNTVEKAFKMIPNDIEKRSDYALMNCSDVVVERMKLVAQGQNFKDLPMNIRPNCWKNGKHSGSDTFGRLVSNHPSVTIRTAAYNPSKGRYIHPVEHRGLNTIEMAVLQDFPLDWTFRCFGREKVTLVSGGKQIGNAVPPGLARVLGIAIKIQLASLHSKESASELPELVLAS